MNAKPTKQHLDDFVAHTVATLPDSLSLRKTVLVTLLYLLPKDHERRQEIKGLLSHLTAHEADQLKLALPPTDGK